MPEVQVSTALEVKEPAAVKFAAPENPLVSASFCPLIQEKSDKNVNNSLSASFDFIKDYLWAGSEYQRILEIEKVLSQANYSTEQAESRIMKRLIKLAIQSATGMSTDKLSDCWAQSCSRLSNESSFMQLPQLAMQNYQLNRELGYFRDIVVEFLSNQTSYDCVPVTDLPLSVRFSRIVQNQGFEWIMLATTTTAIGTLFLMNQGDPRLFGIMASAGFLLKAMQSFDSNRKFLDLDWALCEESNFHNQALKGSGARYVSFDCYADNLYKESEKASAAENFIALRVNRLLNHNAGIYLDSSEYLQQLALSALRKPPFESKARLSDLLLATPDQYMDVKKALLALDRIEFEWTRYQSQRFRELLSSNICLNAH